VITLYIRKGKYASLYLPKLNKGLHKLLLFVLFFGRELDINVEYYNELVLIMTIEGKATGRMLWKSFK